MRTLAERLVWARLDKGARDGADFTQTDLAAKAGVSQGAIGHLESGRTSTSRSITSIAKALDVDPMWLAEGKGEPRTSAAPAVDAPERDTSEFIRGVSRVVPDGIDEDTYPVKLVNLRLQAGFPGFEADRSFEDGGTVNVPQQWIDRNNLVPNCLMAIKVRGDSMEPMLFEDDVVVINIADTKPANGKIYAINFDGQAVVKQMVWAENDWWLHSFNPEHKRRRCRSGECIVIGQVVHRGGSSLIGKL
jgi:phage repressor protein C with HTH and peptisase S24 domain